MATCEQCQSDNLDLVEALPDGRRLIGCNDCGHQWPRGEPTVRPEPTRSSYETAQRLFPTPDDVDPARMAWVNELKSEFLMARPQPNPDVAPYWALYQEVFSEAGLQQCDPQLLKDFANHNTGAGLGNQSVFNRAWNEFGTHAATARTRHSVEYLLYGPQERPLADRLTDVIEDDKGQFMTGFKEALLTKVLCVVYPDRFLPILTYSSDAGGKKEIAHHVYGITLPDRWKVQWTIGRLIVWSNDLLLQLVGDGFPTTQHVSQFLWDAKDQARPVYGTGT